MGAKTGTTEQADHVRAVGRERFHALDSLRAAMMLLGVVLHAGLSYSHMPSNPIWPFKDARSSALCDAVMMVSGLFRMPVFFMVAGFFAAYIVQKRGAYGMMAERLRRVAVPFAAAWLITFPLVRTGFLIAERPLSDRGNALASLLDAGRIGAILEKVGPIHLWFLEYVLIYYAAALASRKVLSPTGQASRSFHRLMRSPFRPVFLAAILMVPLLWSPIGVIPTPLSFWPEPISLVSHGIFFAFGWAVFQDSELLGTFPRHAWKQLAVAIGLLPVAAIALLYRCRALPPPWFGELPPGAASSVLLRPPEGLWLPPANSLVLGLLFQVVLAWLSALIVWLLVIAVTGLFVRYLDGPDRAIRYLADASYWVYLAHFPLTVWLPLALAPVDLPAEVKLLVVVVITMAILLFTYELWVRGTWIGSLVDGGRSAYQAAEGRRGRRSPNLGGERPGAHLGAEAALGLALEQPATAYAVSPFMAGPSPSYPSRSGVSSPCP